MEGVLDPMTKLKRQWVVGCMIAAAGAAGCSGEDAGITGRAINTYDSGSARVERPVTPETWSKIEALVGEGEDLESYPGSLEEGGELSIPDVPEGPYLLSLTSPPPEKYPSEPGAQELFWAEAREIDLGRVYSHRPDLAKIEDFAVVRIDAPLDIPWQTVELDEQGEIVQHLDDELVLVSRGADVTTASLASFLEPGAPVNGATSIGGWELDASCFYGSGEDPSAHLVDGDDVTVLHRVMSGAPEPASPELTDPWQHFDLWAAREAFSLTSFTMKDVGTTPLSGAFEALPAKKFSLDYRGSAFVERLSDLAAPLDQASLTLTIDVDHGGTERPSGTVVPLLWLGAPSRFGWVDPMCNPESCDAMACPGGCPDEKQILLPGDHQGDLVYGNPLDAEELATVQLRFWVNVSDVLPYDEESAYGGRLRGYFRQTAPATELSGQPIVPVVSLPRSLRVNGQPVPTDEITKGVGAAPEISFEPPALGEPDGYVIEVVDASDVQDVSGQILRPFRVVVSLSIPATVTKVTLPEETLRADKVYFARIAARVSDAPPGKPLRASRRSAEAATFTGLFTR